METARRYSPTVPLSIILLALVASAATFFLPTESANPTATHWRAAIATAPMFLFVGAGIVFLRGLKSFKAEVRKAYRLLAFGILAFSLLLGQLVIWGITDTWDSDWATSGSGLVPFVLAAALTYVGARKFARLLQIRNALTSFWLTFFVTMSVSFLMGVLAYYFVTYELESVETYIAVCTWGAMFLTCATILIYKISRSIGSYYREAIRWLAIGVAMFAIASWHEAINTFWFNNGDTYTDYGYYLLPWIITGLLLVYASYKFRQLTNFGVTQPTTQPAIGDRDYIDSIVAVAGLASRPDEVGGLLDELRVTTAKLGEGGSITDTDRRRLLQTFNQLQTYLMQKDPVRTFDRAEILSRVTPAFRKLVKD